MRYGKADMSRRSAAIELKRTWLRFRHTPKRPAYPLACLLIAFVLPVSAADQWIKLITPDFEIYTTNGRRKAIEGLHIFEEARAFFEENSPSKTVPDVPVRIIAFKSEKQYKPYSV